MRCSYERVGWLGSRDLGFSNRDLSKRAGNFAIWTLQPGYPDESGMNSGGPDGVVLHCLLSFPHHKPSIPFNCSDTALGVAKAMVGAKFIIFVFCHVCFVPFPCSNFVPELVLGSLPIPRIFGLFSSRQPGWNFSYEPKVKLVPVNEPARSTGLIWRGPQS